MSTKTAAHRAGPGTGAHRTGIDRALGWVLIIGGLLGAFMAFDLAVEKELLLADPGYITSCSINPLFSCGSVMRTSTSALFGFSNPFLGMVAFPVVATTGVVHVAGSRLPYWYWWWLLVGEVLGVLLVHYLFFMSVYRIQALCPYCMVVWLVTITVFVFTMGHALAQGHVPAPAGIQRMAQRFSGWRWLVAATWYLLIVLAIVIHFWEFWPGMF